MHRRLTMALVLTVATATFVAACSAGGGGGSEGRLGQIKAKKEIQVAGAVSVPLIISSPRANSRASSTRCSASSRRSSASS